MSRGRVVASSNGDDNHVELDGQTESDGRTESERESHVIEQWPSALAAPAPSLDERAVQFGEELLGELPREVYRTGNDGVELHVNAEMLVDGEMLQVSLHYRVVVMRNRRRPR